jgi:tetratricopeptide (TPR) repeat protein
MIPPPSNSRAMASSCFASTHKLIPVILAVAFSTGPAAAQLAAQPVPAPQRVVEQSHAESDASSSSSYSRHVTACLVVLFFANRLLAHSAAAPATPLTSAPDAAQTLSLLKAGRFVELNTRYGVVQSQFDQGEISDETLRAVFRNFSRTDPVLEAQYTSWVRQMPRSYIAHLARAIYYLRIGEERRGGGFISDTSHSQLQGMEAAFAVALEELKKSVALESKPLLSYLYALDVSRYEGDSDDSNQWFHAAITTDPRNFIARQMYMMTLQTAWGGDSEKMRVFLYDCWRAGLPTAQMRRLDALVIANDGWVDEFVKKDLPRAEKEYLRASTLAPDEVPKDEGLAVLRMQRAAADGNLAAQNLLAKGADSRYMILPVAH